MKKGLINLSIALLLFVFASLSALVMVNILKDVVNIENRIIDSIDNSYSTILTVSAANIWRKFLTDNAAYWDYIQSEDNPASSTNFKLNGYIKLNFSAKNEKTYNYSLSSTTTVYRFSEKYINVIFDISKKTKDSENKLPFSSSFDFGWPGI